MNKFISLLMCFIFSMPVLAYPATVARVIDGDTVVLDSGKHIRLAGIDAPEHDQPFGYEARQNLAVLVFSGVNVIEVKTDKYGRTIAWLTAPFNNDINYLMVRQGYAWHYKKYDHNKFYDRAEHAAKFAHIGLWADTNPTPPWDWRHNKRVR